MVTSMEDFVNSAPSDSILASNFLNSPFTLVIIMWRTLNANSLCVGSNIHFVFVEVFTVVVSIILVVYFFCFGFKYLLIQSYYSKSLAALMPDKKELDLDQET